MDAGAALMLPLPAVGTGFSSWGRRGCLSVCLSVFVGLTAHGCCCPLPHWDEKGFAVSQLIIPVY